MIKSLKKNKKFSMYLKMVNMLMKHGKKKTSEKLVLKFLKFFQKSTNKNAKTLFSLALMNTTFTFKVKEQTIKRGKRKTTRINPVFLTNNYLRIAMVLKFIKENVAKDNNRSVFYKAFVKEILLSAEGKGVIIDKKNNLQKQLLTNKRYLSKFRW